MDVVIFWGAGQRREDLIAITGAASDAGLDYRIVEILDDDFLSNSVKKDLYCSGELGPHTQVIGSFATGDGPAANTHSLSLSEDGRQILPAVDFINWLRTPPGEPEFPVGAPWRGTVHAFWPRSGRLRDDYQAQRLSWLSGPTISYAWRKGGSVHNAVTAMLDLCAYVGTVKGQAPYLEPEYIAARMLCVAGDTVACLGGRFKRAIVVGAPRTSAQAQHDYLIDGLNGCNGRPPRMTGARKDLQALAGAMRHPLVGGMESKRQRSKAENVFMVRAERYKLAAMDELRTAHPSLLVMREHTGRSGLQIYRRVSSSLIISREMHVLSARQGDAGNLLCLLENIAMVRRHGIRFTLNLANLIHGRADLQTAGLQWAAEHDDEDLFFHMLQAVNPPDRPGLMEQCYTLALQTSRSLAMALLALVYPQATVAQLIAHGINNGASQKVVCAWLSETDWITSHRSTEVVLAALARHKLFGILASQARDYPGRLRQLMTVMYENQALYSSHAEALLQHAQETRDLPLYRQLEQGYFQVERSDAAQPVTPGKNKTHAVTEDI
jgi:hypothetical protein